MTSGTVSATQVEARALGDPTRHAIFRALVETEVPMAVADLNQAFPLNHNAIRQHLAKLVDAGLVVETRSAPAGRGRPRLLYTVDPAVAGRWGTEGPYERLSRLLVEIIRSGQGPEAVGRQAADQFRVPAPSGDVVADVGSAMARQGFDPEIRSGRGVTEVVLRSCPFAEIATIDRATICELHLGIAEGLVEGTDTAVTDLIAYDPRRAGCRLRLRAGGPSQPAAELVLRSRAPTS